MSFWNAPAPDVIAQLSALKANLDAQRAREFETWGGYLAGVVERWQRPADRAVATWRVFALPAPKFELSLFPRRGEPKKETIERIYVLLVESALGGTAHRMLPGPDIVQVPFWRPSEPGEIERLVRAAEAEVRLEIGRAASEIWARIDALPGRWSGLAPVAEALLEGRVPL